MIKENKKIIYTIGHSNIPVPQFLDLLQTFKIDVVVDVRSRPYSKYATQFGKDQIHQALSSDNIMYIYMGDSIGGKPREETFYDYRRYVMYDRLAGSASFQTGISRLMKGIVRGYRIALMCSEEDPTDCHRRLLIGRVLREQGVDVQHIRKGGTIHTEKDLNTTGIQIQPDLFGNQADLPWRSAQPVL